MDIKQIRSDLKARVAKGLNFGIEAVEEVLDPGADTYNEFILLKSKYNDLMYISSINTLPYEQIAVGMDRLRNHLLTIIDKLEEPGMQRSEINPDLRVQALPARRTNFFKLLDIHFRNLEDIAYVEIYGEQESRKAGREAVFELYHLHRRHLRRQEELKGTEGLDRCRAYFREYFGNENGSLEVYFKNIRHLLDYTLESELDRPFFLDTLRSLFSRYELGLIFYYALSGMDDGFRGMVVESRLIDESVKPILIDGAHWPELFGSSEG